MDITKKNLQEAANKNIISCEQVDSLYDFLNQQSQNTPKFTINHILYYLGGILAIFAMSIFMGLSWDLFNGAGTVAVSIIYAIVGLKLTHYFAQKGFTVPAGICATFVVCLTPVAIYGLQQWLGILPDNIHHGEYQNSIKWHRIFMEIGTLVVGVIIALRYKYPFLLMPIAITLWVMTVDITSMIYGDDFTWYMRKLVSLYTGLIMIAFAFWLDIKFYKKADYAFWIYLFGVIAFWSGLSSLDSDSELSKFLYFCVNLLMICVGAILARRVFVIFGAAGVALYIGYLATNIFDNVWLFPITLTALGIGIVYLGMLWQKNEQALTKILRSKLPSSLRELLEAKD